MSASLTQSVRDTLSVDIRSVAATLTAQPPASTSIPGPTGIFENNYVRFSGSKLGVEAVNGWGGVVDGKIVGIWAGSVIGDPEQGVLYLMLNYTYEESFVTETKHGALRILAEQNNRLTAVAIDGTAYYFDVPARCFVTSLDEVVPSVTPFGSITPDAPPPIPTPTVNQYPAPLVSTPQGTAGPP
jgi:hypothetical protein